MNRAKERRKNEDSNMKKFDEAKEIHFAIIVSNLTLYFQ